MTSTKYGQLGHGTTMRQGIRGREARGRPDIRFPWYPVDKRHASTMYGSFVPSSEGLMHVQVCVLHGVRDEGGQPGGIGVLGQSPRSAEILRIDFQKVCIFAASSAVHKTGVVCTL